MGEFSFRCICCNTAIDVATEHVGFVVYCPECMAELIVPEFTGDDVPASVAADIPDDLEPTDSVRLYPDTTQINQDLHATDSVVLQPEQDSLDSFYVPEEPGGEPQGNTAAVPPRSSASISQVIYRDTEGNPIIPEDVARAVSGGPDSLSSLTDTKMALAETLRALQENQRALAEARLELSARRHQSDTDHVKISDTSNHLVREDVIKDTSHMHETMPMPPSVQDVSGVQHAPGGLSGLDESPNVFAPRDEDTEELDVTGVDHQVSVDDDTCRGSVEYTPLYTPHGDFLPFADDDFSQALQYEHSEVLEAVSQIHPTPQCWSYSVFALLLESHINAALPEVVPVVPMTGVFFGGTQKYLDEVNEQYVVFMNIMRRMMKPMGEEFQHALSQHDIYAYIEILSELDQPMHELYQFMINFQHVPLPKKEPFLKLRSLMLQFYDDVRFRLVKVVDRLDERCELTPEVAKMGTVSVSLLPYTIHEFGLLMTHFSFN